VPPCPKRKFHQYSAITWKRCEIECNFVSIANRKLYGLSIGTKSVTLNDVERRNDQSSSVMKWEMSAYIQVRVSLYSADATDLWNRCSAHNVQYYLASSSYMDSSPSTCLCSLCRFRRRGSDCATFWVFRIFFSSFYPVQRSIFKAAIATHRALPDYLYAYGQSATDSAANDCCCCRYRCRRCHHHHRHQHHQQHQYKPVWQSFRTKTEQLLIGNWRHLSRV